jgi:hypothetical protein
MAKLLFSYQEIILHRTISGFHIEKMAFLNMECSRMSLSFRRQAAIASHAGKPGDGPAPLPEA